jgi:ABC-2 type transport system permease protein
MNRMMAIVEREMRKFFRSPTLMLASMIFPLVQLIVLGNAFGGKIKDARLGVVDQDGGTQALKIRQAFDSVRANMRTFVPVYYDDEKTAREDVRNGKIQGAVIIPPQYSRRVYEKDRPQIALVVDNSDNFMSSTLEQELADITNALNQPAIEPRLLQQTVLQIVELYPYIEYMKYLLPGSITLAMFVSVMIGGGMLYIDDKARGIHEGYLVTPITKAEMVFGLNLAGAIKAVLTGVVITVIGALLAGVSTIFNPGTALGLLLMIVLTSIAFNTMMFLLMVRVDDPLVPRAIFGILNTLLFFPSGSIYPVQAFPAWLRVIAKVDPFTYGRVQGIAVEGAGFMAIVPDMFYLGIRTVALPATLPFKRTSGVSPGIFCPHEFLADRSAATFLSRESRVRRGAPCHQSCRLHGCCPLLPTTQTLLLTRYGVLAML